MAGKLSSIFPSSIADERTASTLGWLKFAYHSKTSAGTLVQIAQLHEFYTNGPNTISKSMHHAHVKLSPPPKPKSQHLAPPLLCDLLNPGDQDEAHLLILLTLIPSPKALMLRMSLWRTDLWFSERVLSSQLSTMWTLGARLSFNALVTSLTTPFTSHNMGCSQKVAKEMWVHHLSGHQWTFLHLDFAHPTFIYSLSHSVSANLSVHNIEAQEPQLAYRIQSHASCL